MRVLSFSAKSGHGKDTCARIAQEIFHQEHNKNLGIWSFAHPLKALVYGEGAGRLTFDDVWVKKPPEVRDRLQKRGTEEGRMVFGEDVWVLQTEAYLKIMEAWGFVHAVAIPDARFPNEITFTQLGGNTGSRVLGEISELVKGVLGYTDEREEDLLKNDPQALYQLDIEYGEMVNHLWAQRVERAPGLSIWIESDRPTLTGEAAQHASETAFDHWNKAERFDHIITNNTATSFEDLRVQLRPIIHSLLYDY